jgi:hypothetical protein
LPLVGLAVLLAGPVAVSLIVQNEPAVIHGLDTPPLIVLGPAVRVGGLKDRQAATALVDGDVRQSGQTGNRGAHDPVGIYDRQHGDP